jgi:hypothetical protein
MMQVNDAGASAPAVTREVLDEVFALDMKFKAKGFKTEGPVAPSLEESKKGGGHAPQ